MDDDDLALFVQGVIYTLNQEYPTASLDQLEARTLNICSRHKWAKHLLPYAKELLAQIQGEYESRKGNIP